jgi:uncharacterized small protein (DUF1192 family)
MNLDDPPKPKHDHVLGESLETISAEELKNRVQILKAEIERIEVEIVKKLASRSAADAFFKS